ncbi:MAG: hypothetical protein MZV70_36025 [Desulfobacterales bacterium]|nr:hypothetical protein [Desulfobacterales bacterium]
MNKMIGMAAVLLLTGTTAFGADVESRLPAGTSDRVRASVRETIRAGVDPEEVVALTARMVENRFGERLTVRAHEIVTAARQEKLPVEPIVNKAHEGMAKRVAAEKTVQAMETVRSRYSLCVSGGAGPCRRRQAAGAGKDHRRRAHRRHPRTGYGEDRARGPAAEPPARPRTEDRPCGPVLSDGPRHGRDWASPPSPSRMSYARPCSISSRPGKWRRSRNTFAADARQGKAEGIAQQYGAQIGGGARGGRSRQLRQ